MATITLVANTSYSDLTVADGDTIDLAGFRLTFDINPTQENVIVHSPGTGGTVDLPTAIDVFDFPGWEFTAGTANLLPSVALSQTVGGTWVGGVGGQAITTNHGTITGSVRGSATATYNGLGTNNGDVQGQIIGGGIPGAYGIQANNGIVTGSVSPDVGPGIRFNYGAAIGPVKPGGVSQYRNHTLICNGPVWEDTTSSPYNKVILSLFGPLHPNATVAPGTEVIVLSGDVAAAIANGQRPNHPTRIVPGVAPRLSFVVLDSDGVPVQDLAVAGITSASYVTITNGVRSSASTVTLSSKVADTATHSTGQLVTIHPSEGWYAIDAPAGAALSSADYAELVVTLTDNTRLVYPTMHPIDASVSGIPVATRTELATELSRIDVAVSSRNAVTPPTVAQLNNRTLPTADYFDPYTDTVARVTLVDTTTVNTDMRGTNGANTTTPPTAASIATAVWAAGTRTLTAISDSSGMTTLLSRVTGLIRTKAQADAANDAIPGAVRTELATELAHIDADISSRNATEPDNIGIAAIQAKTDNLPGSPAAVGSEMTLNGDYDAAKNAASQTSVDTLPKYGDTTKRTLVSDGPTELTETITRVP